jgi:hypothetical protein
MALGMGIWRLALALGVTFLAGHTQAAVPATDPWLPGSGRFDAAVATGVPFLVMSELSLGISDHAALGVLAGTTPIVAGFGLRPRGALPLWRGTRLLLSAPLVYYPERSDGSAWWLTRPSAQLSWRPAERWTLAAGGGAVAIATQSALSGDPEPNATSAYGRRLWSHRTDLWWTANALALFAINERTQLFADVTGIFRGYEPAGSDWIGGPPVIAFLGVSTRL